jgi:transcriptional regulator GlxA family with amidase domain
MNCRPPDPRITWIVDYMQRHMADPLSVEGLARLINLSRSRFTSLFTAQTGAAPMRYLQRIRLRRARLLVERTFLSVKETMVLVGYNDPSHFARDFRREYGVAPSELQTRTPSADPLTKRPIGPPRGRDPGNVYA